MHTVIHVILHMFIDAHHMHDWCSHSYYISNIDGHVLRHCISPGTEAMYDLPFETSSCTAAAEHMQRRFVNNSA